MSDPVFDSLLNTSCTIRRYTLSGVDGYGQPVEIWAALSTGVPCRLQDLAGGEAAEVIGPGGTLIVASHKMWLDSAADILEKDRVDYAAYYVTTGTTLGAAITSTSATTFTSSNGGAMIKWWSLLIDSEQMLVSGISTNTITVTRGYGGTTAATHLNGATVYRLLTLDVQFVALQPGGETAHHKAAWGKIVR